MTQDVIKELEKEAGEVTAMHQQMLTDAKQLVQMSIGDMSGYYDRWDLQDEVFRGLRRPDKEDLEQSLEGKPVKVIVPNTYAQVMTFASFLFLTFKQNPRLLELTPTASKMFGSASDDAELILERDMRYNDEARFLFQYLLDLGKFGPAISSCEWTRQVSKIYAPTDPAVATINGIQIESLPGSEWQDVVKYEGNLVRNISPYHFFPDTRFSLAEFTKGDFCAHEEQYSMGDLSSLEAQGEVAGVDFIQPLPQDFARLRGGGTRFSFELNQRYMDLYTGTKSKTAPVIVTKMQRWIVPSKYKTSDGKALGPEEFKVLYHLWYANDCRIIRLEPCRWWHNEYGYTVSQFTPDMSHTCNLGLADLVYRLQDIISWLFNSRIKDVRRNVFGRNVVDPRIIDTKTLDGEGDIYLRKGMSVPIDRALYPLPMNNVTQGHIPETQMINGMLQVISGVNDNMQGQTGKGRRSAREVGDANGGATGRMKLHATLTWESGPGRLARLMHSNERQACTEDSFRSVVGDGDPLPPQMTPMGPVPAMDASGQPATDFAERYAKYKGTPVEVARGSHYFTFDSTTPSEKGQLAANLQELFSVILQTNPMAAAQLSQEIDPGLLLDEITRLRGAGPIRRFTPKQQMTRALAQPQPGLGGIPQ
jgi:hypothetical protein